MIKFFKRRRKDFSGNSGRPEIVALRAYIRLSVLSESYLLGNPDVTQAGVDPVVHWINYGVYEGRALPGYDYNISNVFERKDGWDLFKIERGFLQIKEKPQKVPDYVMKAILSAAMYEPAVLYPGIYAIPYLRQFRATDLRDRDGLVSSLAIAEVDYGAEVIFLIPALVIGGAEKYVADLVSALVSIGFERITVIVTEQLSQDAVDCNKVGILEPYTSCRLVFWRDISPEGYRNAVSLAYFINAARPKHLIVVNSAVGLELVHRYGRGISSFAKIVCAYFSMGKFGLGIPYGAVYPRRNSRFSLALTDNKKMAGLLLNQLGAESSDRIVTIPPFVSTLNKSDFNEKIRRLSGFRSLGRRAKWLWISRVEPMKGTKILSEIAEIRSDDQFDIYGPVSGSLGALGLEKRNINYCGVMDDISGADFSEYSGFIFTSLAEGMPNVVLEMSQHALPIISTDVGGLRETFSDESIYYVVLQESLDSLTRDFNSMLANVLAAKPDELEQRAILAYEQVLKVHSRSAHESAVSRLFGGVYE